MLCERDCIDYCVQKSVRVLRKTKIAAFQNVSGATYRIRIVVRTTFTLPLRKGDGLYGAQVESNMLNYDLTPAKWASGNSTMRFSVEN